MKVAIWRDTVLAESDQTLEVDGRIYFPPSSIKREHFQPSDHTTECSWKGTAHYYNVALSGQCNENAAWFYPEPKPEASKIKDYVAFWKDVNVAE